MCWSQPKAGLGFINSGNVKLFRSIPVNIKLFRSILVMCGEGQSGLKIHIPGPYRQRVDVVGLGWMWGQSLLFQLGTPGSANASGHGDRLSETLQDFIFLPLQVCLQGTWYYRVNDNPLPGTTTFYLITNLRSNRRTPHGHFFLHHYFSEQVILSFL